MLTVTTSVLALLLAAAQPPTRWIGRPLEQNLGPIHALTVAADGRRISSDGRWVRVWAPDGATPVAVLDTGDLEAQALCVSPDSKLLFVRGRGFAAYALPGGEKRWEYRANMHVNTGTFTPDCRFGALVLGNGDVQLLALHALPKAPARTLSTGRTNSSGTSVAGVTLSATGARVAVVSSDARLELYDGATGARQAELQPPLPSSERADGDIASLLAFVGEDELVGLYAARQQARSWKLKPTPSLTQVPLALEMFRGVAPSPDGRTVALSAEGTLQLVDLKERKLVRTIRAGEAGPLAWAGADAVLVGTRDGRITRVALSGEAAEPPRSSDPAWLVGLAFSPDGKRVATVVEERQPGIVRALELWDVATGQRVVGAEQELEAGALTGEVTFVPGTSSLYWQGGAWALEAGELHRKQELPESGVAVSADGKVRAFARCESIEVQDAQGKLLRALEMESRQYDLGDRGHIEPADHCSVALSQDGARMASWGRGDLKLWNPRTGKLLHTVGKQPLQVPLFDANLNAVWLVDLRDPSEVIRRFDLRTGKVSPLPAPAYGVAAAALSRDGTRLALAASNGTVELRDAKTLKVLKTLGGTQCTPGALALSPNGGTLALGCERGAVALWKLR